MSVLATSQSERIPRLPGNMPRPLWTVLIPTYNCGRYLHETLDSVLSQDLGPETMEIIVVDDHSTADDPGDIVNRIAGDRIRFIRQPQNIGKGNNFESGLLASRGYLIHQLHGDDRVRNGFYEKMASFFEAFPQIGAAFCRSLYVDSAGRWIGITGLESDTDGVIPDFLDRIYVGQRVQTPAMVVSRKVYEDLGGFNKSLPCFEDWEMWIRVAKNYPVGCISEVLAEYRVYPENTSRQTLLDGTRLRTHRQLLRWIDESLEGTLVRQKRKARNQAQADYWTDLLRQARKSLSYSHMYQIILYCVQLAPSFRTIRRLTSIFL